MRKIRVSGMRPLLLLMLLLLAAGGVYAGGQSEATGPAQPVELTLYQFQVGIVDQMAEIAEIYNTQNPEVRLVTDRPGTDYFETLKAMFAGGTGPDIFSLNAWTMVRDYQQAEIIVSLSREEWAGRIVDGAKPGVTIDGDVYALPMEVAGIGVVYNRTIFSDLGLTPPRTIAELEHVVEVLNANDIIPFSVAFQAPWTLRHLFSMGHTTIVDDVVEFADRMNAGNASFVSSAMNDVFRVFDIIADNAQPRPFDTDYTAQCTLVGEGKAAMLTQGLWALDLIRQVDPDFDAGMFALPVSREPSDAKLMVDANSVYVVTAGTDREQPAREFLRWLAMTENAAMYASKTNTIPALVGVPMREDADPAMFDIQQYADSGNTVPWGFSIWPTGFDDEVGSMMQEYFAGRKTRDELLAEFDSLWRRFGR